MTIKDIARESGYAVGTVSRVLNNNPRVSEDARRKILAVVAQHGYQPNANAKHLKQQVPEGLALIVKGTQNALFADLLDKLQPCLEARGYTPTVYYNNGSTDELACAQTIFAERRPCGLFFIGAHPQCFTPALASLGIPCLLLTNNAAGLGIENLSSVSVDDRAAAAVMIEQLYVSSASSATGPKPPARASSGWTAVWMPCSGSACRSTLTGSTGLRTSRCRAAMQLPSTCWPTAPALRRFSPCRT